MIKAKKKTETQPIKTVTYEVEGTDVELGILRGQAKDAVSMLQATTSGWHLNEKKWDQLTELLKMVAEESVPALPLWNPSSGYYRSTNGESGS